MSSFKNAAKSFQKSHRERSQPAARKHLGALEKKKDYKQRANDYQKKQRALKTLRKKALDRNPDEFYFNMVRSGLEDGVHRSKESAPDYTPEQLKLLHGQDLKYINYKRSTEVKKIERLKSSLHMLDTSDKPVNKHTFFVDTKKEAMAFNPADRLNTHPSLLNRTYNRPTREMLKDGKTAPKLDKESVKEILKERKKQYKELNKRVHREKELRVVSRKLEVKKHLLDKKTNKEKILDETKSNATVYKWTCHRKR